MTGPGDLYADAESQAQGETKILEADAAAGRGIAGSRAATAVALSLNPPYPQFCRDIRGCSGLGSCPRDPSCCE